MSIIMKTIKLSVISLMYCLSQQVQGITAQELQSDIENGETLTIIDVRNTQAYKEGHIPSAINIPALIIPKKKLPPLGRIVVYGDGFQTKETNAVVNALNQKKGIQAELLEGGIATWQNFNLPDTSSAGMKDEVLRHISYLELVELASNNNDIVLVDLRLARKGQVLTDIDEQIPGLEIVRPIYRDSGKQGKYQLRSLISRNDEQISPLYILIDNGDEMSEKVYRRFKASGVKRIAILAGGELILSRHGLSGHQLRIIKSGEVQ